MGKISIKVNCQERRIQIFSQMLEKELEELISLACCYNANYKYDEKESGFYIVCFSDDAVEKLKEEYEKYFFSK